jgi:hypothetical protein
MRKMKMYRMIMVASMYIRPCMSKPLRKVMSSRQKGWLRGPNRYLNRVGICTRKFQLMANHIPDARFWFIRVRWWLFRSNQMMPYRTGVVKKIPRLEKKRAKYLEIRTCSIAVKR